MDAKPIQLTDASDTGLADLIDCALDAVWIVDEHDIVHYVNPAATELCGYAPEELIGGPFSRVLSRETAVLHAGYFRDHLDRGGGSRVLGKLRELTILSRSGKFVQIELKAFKISPRDGTMRFGAIMRDITQRKQNEARQRRLLEKMQRIAAEDELTRLPNRRGFFDALHRIASAVKRHGRPACVAMIDIDRFKRVNDRYGHDAGDRTLAAVAGIMSASMRSEDLVARIGGEEFAVLFPDTEIGAAHAALERLLANVRSTPIILSDGVALTVTVSAGLTAIEPTGDDANCLQAADAALLKAKKSGRDRVHADFDDSIPQAAAE